MFVFFRQTDNQQKYVQYYIDFSLLFLNFDAIKLSFKGTMHFCFLNDNTNDLITPHET